MVVGDDVAVGGNDEARAERAAALGGRTIVAAAAAAAAATATATTARASPPKRRKNSSKPGGSRRCCTCTLCRVEILTTAGCSRSARSAKLPGAPRGAFEIAPGSFCAVCAPTGLRVSVAAAPPRRMAAVTP
jgi:hypothetical protein